LWRKCGRVFELSRYPKHLAVDRGGILATPDPPATAQGAIEAALIAAGIDYERVAAEVPPTQGQEMAARAGKGHVSHESGTLSSDPS
jgi:hypothetical protein